MTREILSYKAYVWILAMIGASLSISIFSTNFFQIALLVGWLIMPGLKERWKKLITRPSVLIFLSGYLILLISIVYSSDLTYALHDLKIKLPLFVLPLIIASSEPLEKREFKFVLLAFVSGVFLSTLISSAVYYEITPVEVIQRSDISIFISHIRFALLIVLAIFILFYYIAKEHELYFKTGLILLVFWLITFLFILQSLTGIVIFFLLLLLMLAFFSIRSNDLMGKIFGLVALATIVLFSSSFVVKSIARFYYKDQIVKENIKTHTLQGNLYRHDFNDQRIENGHYVGLYVCEKELAEAWNKVSKHSYGKKDKRGQEISLTLIRYLSSLDLPKDAYGVSQLTIKDIENIEKGIANYIFAKKIGLYPRFYEILWEVEHYKKGGDPSGHSVAQRLEFLKAASHIFKSSPLIGVGVGDVKNAFKEAYEELNSNLSQRWRLRTHNQFFTYIIAVGCFGAAFVFLSWFLPVFMEKKWFDYLFVVFFLIALLSMLNEDTLETSTGVSFFAFFYSILLFGRKNETDSIDG